MHNTNATLSEKRILTIYFPVIGVDLSRYLICTFMVYLFPGNVYVVFL